MADNEVTDEARNNTVENFKLVFDRNFPRTVISQMDENDTLFRRTLDDPDFQEAVKDFYGTKGYREASKRLMLNAFTLVYAARLSAYGPGTL